MNTADILPFPRTAVLSLSNMTPKIAGKRASLVILDDIDCPNLDACSDNAEDALNAYQDAAGSTGDDLQDVIELIADLLHLVDDLYLKASPQALRPTRILANAMTTYARDRQAALS